jgi:hypothetical protein
MVLISKYRTEGSMFTVIYTPSFGMDQNVLFIGENIVALNPELDGVGSNMHCHNCP